VDAERLRALYAQRLEELQGAAVLDELPHANPAPVVMHCR
jgi:hypothetical protein